MLTISKSRK